MLAEIVSTTILVLSILIIVRALMSWIPNLDPRNPIVEFVVTITEPILAPIRSVMPRGCMFDFTPMVAIFILYIIGRIIVPRL